MCAWQFSFSERTRGEKSTSCNRRETRVKPYSVCGRVVGGASFWVHEWHLVKGERKGAVKWQVSQRVSHLKNGRAPFSPPPYMEWIICQCHLQYEHSWLTFLEGGARYLSCLWGHKISRPELYPHIALAKLKCKLIFCRSIFGVEGKC